MRSKDEGGTTFFICDECWDKHYPPKPLKDKVKAVKEILRRLDPDNQYDDAVLTADASEICQLFPMKIKLPKVPLPCPEPIPQDSPYYRGFEEDIQQVKEALEKAGVEVEE